jgi:hypothetical protein
MFLALVLSLMSGQVSAGTSEVGQALKQTPQQAAPAPIGNTAAPPPIGTTAAPGTGNPLPAPDTGKH